MGDRKDADRTDSQYARHSKYRPLSLSLRDGPWKQRGRQRNRSVCPKRGGAGGGKPA